MVLSHRRRQFGGGWPAAKLALVTRDRLTRHALHAGGAARLLAVSDEVDHAVHRVHQRPIHVRAGCTCPPTAPPPCTPGA